MAHTTPSSLDKAKGDAYSPEYHISGDPETPKAIYTTAGTLYNPKSAQSLQPPVRRGRATKWTSATTPSSELSLLPKSALATLPLRGWPRGDANPVPEYSPLQQNTDRAISPSKHRKPTQEYQRQYQDGLDEGTEPSFRIRNIDQMIAVAAAAASDSAALTTSTMEARDSQTGDGDTSDDDLGHATLQGFPVKSLHNLASYPNPNQKRARKALLSARRPASASGTSNENTTRASTPLCYRPGLDWDGSAKDFVSSACTPNQPTADVDDLYRRFREAKSRDVVSLLSNDKTLSSGDVFFDTASYRAKSTGGYRSTLAQGPGAPKPLTAGPPGFRQYRTLACDLPSHTPVCNNTKSTPLLLAGYYALAGLDGIVDGKNRGPPPGLDQASIPLYQWQNPDPRAAAAEAARETANAAETSERLQELRQGSIVEPKNVLKPRKNNSGVHALDYCVDTLPGEMVRKYYRQGLPRMTEPHPIDPDWVNKDASRLRIERGPGSWQRSVESLQRHNERVGRAFYAGNREVGKTMDFVIDEAERRRQQRTIGVISDRRRVSNEPRREITMKEASSMPTEEATKSLLPLVLSTLLRQADARSSNSQYRQDYLADAYLVGSRESGEDK